MRSSCISSSVRIEKKVENRNFFLFHPIYLKFGIGGNFEMLITKRRPKLKLENNLSKKCNFLLIFAKITPITLQQQRCHVDVTWDWFVFKINAYWYIVKVTKFEVPHLD